MRYRHLKNANVDVSVMAVGTWAIGGANYGPVNREDSIKAIRAMIDNGVNLVDTAPVYGNGYSEQLVGEALQDGYREKVMLATKFGLAGSILQPGLRDASFKGIMREVASSLKNLKTDYIDFYFVHWPDVNTPIAETMSALNLLKQMGVIRHIGVSNFSQEQIEEAMKYGQIDVQQPPFSMVNQKDIDLIRWGYEKGIDSFTYGSLGAGILTGVYRSTPDFPANDLRWHFYDFFNEPKFSKIMELLKVMDQIAANHGNVPVAQVALNWSTQKEYVGTALVGVVNAQQANENCAAFSWELDQAEIDLLDQEMLRLGLTEKKL